MSGGDIAALIAAGAFAMLVLVACVPIYRLRKTVDAATQAINDLNDRTAPVLGNVNATVENVNTALGQVPRHARRRERATRYGSTRSPATRPA